MRQAHYQEIAFKALAFIKANAGKSLSVPEIAKHAGYSSVHVRTAFKKVLNQTIVSTILTERIRLAKILLTESNQGIAGIAFESGFGDHANFTKAFRKAVGMSPLDFRKQVAQLKEIPSQARGATRETGERWFKDSFAETDLGRYWKPYSGLWHNANGCMMSEGADSRIAFLRPLPENFRISMQIMLKPYLDFGMPDVAITLMNEVRERAYCDFSIATGKRDFGAFLHSRYGRIFEPKARIGEEEWHDFTLEAKDNSFRFFIDKKEVFFFRDSFPPVYSSRCYVHLRSWRCAMHIRSFEIQNLGFLPASNPIRQGDALYNAGLPEKAVEFYLRFLESGPADDVIVMELRYKIAMCCLQQKAFSNAQAWIDKVVALKEEPFWAEQARLSLLELSWKAMDFAGIQEHILLCIGDQKTRASARGIIWFAAVDLDSRGFIDETIAILQLWVSLERQINPNSLDGGDFLAEQLQKARKNQETEEIWRRHSLSGSLEQAVYSRVNLAQLYHEWGKLDHSEATRKEIESMTKDPSYLVRCAIQKALNLRAQGRFEEALEIFEEIPTRYAIVEVSFHNHARIQCALILCYLGRLVEGRKVLEELNANAPGSVGNRHYLPFLLAEGNSAAAAESLLSDYRNARELVSSSAELGIKAGILHELAGLEREANAIFKEVSLRFPNEQVRFFGPMAHALFTGGDFDFAEMPYEAHRRSEMFYLLGLLSEKRDETDAAHAFFKLSMIEDPALRWPAYFAKRLLAPNAEI